MAQAFTANRGVTPQGTRRAALPPGDRPHPWPMIFILCRNGVSIQPDEYAAPANIERGAQVQAATLGKLASE